MDSARAGIHRPPGHRRAGSLALRRLAQRTHHGARRSFHRSDRGTNPDPLQLGDHRQQRGLDDAARRLGGRVQVAVNEWARALTGTSATRIVEVTTNASGLSRRTARAMIGPMTPTAAQTLSTIGHVRRRLAAETAITAVTTAPPRTRTGSSRDKGM